MKKLFTNIKNFFKKLFKKEVNTEVVQSTHPVRKQYELNDIPQEMFSLAHQDESIHDTKFETKPVSFIKDAMHRFAKNKASVVAAILIAIISLFAIIEPIVDPKNKVQSSLGFQDTYYSEVLPSLGDATRGSGFWDGSKKVEVRQDQYDFMRFTDAKRPIISKFIKKEHIVVDSKFVHLREEYDLYTVRQDSYAMVGCQSINGLTQTQIDAIKQYEIEKGVSILKPIVDVEGYINRFASENGLSVTSEIVNKLKLIYNNRPYNYAYYEIVPKKRDNGEYISGTAQVVIDENDNCVPIYLKDSNGDLVYQKDDGNGTYTIRVDYYEYFTYMHGFEPAYIFGATGNGQDICLKLAKGIRFSLMLGIGISLINFIIGLVYGAISGYYGGVADLIMERVTDIISTIPTIIIMTVCSIQFTNNVSLKASIGATGVLILSFLVAFVYNGWVGVASTTRMQFYRFKGQEYVLASRTLGAKDGRLIFKHILPNAAGTLVTSCVLMVPSVIFSESSLSFLGIVDFTFSGISSVGALLDEGQKYLSSAPHMVLFPAIVISILMISFNLLGNGLRDAFNTSLRGSED